ncbi:hypothetical protein D3C76_468060 [compost metagenome]
MGERQGGVEVRLGGGAVADPRRGDLGIALDRRGHGPADRLHELGRQVAADGEETCLAHRIHDRQLAALERVALVGQQLADQVHQRHVAGHEDALLAVGREAHVGDIQGQRLGTANGFFAQALHIERHFLLALGDHHAVVVDAGLEHGAHALAQDLVRDAFGPWAESLAMLVEHANQAIGQVGRVGRVNIDRGLADLAGIVQVQVGEVGLAARAAGGFGNMQTQGFIGVHAFSTLAQSCVFVGRRSCTTFDAKSGPGRETLLTGQSSIIDVA